MFGISGIDLADAAMRLLSNLNSRTQIFSQDERLKENSCESLANHSMQPHSL